MENDRTQIVDRLKQSTNVLITVNNNPTVDQLAACIGVTLLLNKMGKHATAVFSGKVPSTIEFLKPEETLEKNTDSLRDFIIALDKAKADKLRYKVEDTMVKIFITPYKTSISDKDLEFSQGDFNIDVILALGIHDREQIDQAIMAHGRILHDAVIMTVDSNTGSNLGTINWVEEQASSLCEMLASVVDDLQSNILDGQIATALLTGIVAETERFSNEKTTSSTMGVSSKLMAAGADQHLVATELEPKPEPIAPPIAPVAETQPEASPQQEQPPEKDDGAIVIDHEEEKSPEAPELPPVDPNEINIDDEGTMKRSAELAEEEAKRAAEAAAAQQAAAAEDNGAALDQSQSDKSVMTNSPSLGGTFTASGRAEPLEPSSDPLSSDTQQQPLLNKAAEPPVTTNTSVADILSQGSSEATPVQTLEEIEEAVHKDEAAQVAEQVASDVDSARNAVNNVINNGIAEGTIPPGPTMAQGAKSVDLDMGHPEEPAPALPEQPAPPVPVVTSPDLTQTAVNPSTGEPQYPTNLVPPSNDLPPENTSSSVDMASSPPPVPPPMMPPAMPPVDNSTLPS